MDPAFYPLLACPRCKTGTFGSDPICTKCGHQLDVAKGYVETLSLDGSDPLPSTNEQRFMESELVARLYDRVWRPTFVRVLAGAGAGASVGGLSGEMFIHKHSLGLDDRPGPWLDVSCGPGAFTRAIAAQSPSALVVGLDISKAMLEVAAQRTAAYKNVCLVRGDAHALPFVAGIFGGVNNAGALHAYDDPEQAFREVLRVLAPGGVFVGSTFADARSLAGRMAARLAGIRRFAPKELRAWLQRLGFAEYEDVRMGDAIIFRARKP